MSPMLTAIGSVHGLYRDGVYPAMVRSFILRQTGPNGRAWKNPIFGLGCKYIPPQNTLQIGVFGHLTFEILELEGCFVDVSRKG